jgi:hypothetical protein
MRLSKPSHDKLYCKKSKWHARESYVLGNGLLRLTTLPGGGHVAEIRFDKLSGNSTVNPLWVPPWTLISIRPPETQV